MKNQSTDKKLTELYWIGFKEAAGLHEIKKGEEIQSPRYEATLEF